MAMTLSIQAHSMQLDVLDDVTESGNVPLLNMHDANSNSQRISFGNTDMGHFTNASPSSYSGIRRLLPTCKGLEPCDQAAR